MHISREILSRSSLLSAFFFFLFLGLLGLVHMPDTFLHRPRDANCLDYLLFAFLGIPAPLSFSGCFITRSINQRFWTQTPSNARPINDIMFLHVPGSHLSFSGRFISIPQNVAFIAFVKSHDLVVTGTISLIGYSVSFSGLLCSAI
jgi:hypothetical protein